MSDEIDPKAIEVADDWIHEHIQRYDIMSCWKDSLGEAIQAYAQEQVQADRERIDKALVEKSAYFQGIIDEYYELGGTSELVLARNQAKIGVIAYIRMIIGGYPK